MQKKTKIIIGIVIFVLLAGFAYMVYNLRSKDKEISDMSQQFQLEKESLTDDYSQLALQYEGYGLRVGNDSIAQLLEAERYKVQGLLEELKITKATDTRRISKLRRELVTLRGVMRHYVEQIDSLNKMNTRLKAENKEVTQRFNESQKSVVSLSEEKKALTEKVTLASILDAKNITVESLTSKGRKATKIKKTSQIKFSFTIAKNVSAPRGEKYIYIRIIQPDETPLVKRNDNVFLFENKYINYSARRPIEFDGDDTQVTIFWDVEEYLHPGNYRVEVFADGYQIGSRTFTLQE